MTNEVLTEMITISDAAIALLILDDVREKSNERQLKLMARIRALKLELADLESQLANERDYVMKNERHVANTLDVAKQVMGTYKSPR